MHWRPQPAQSSKHLQQSTAALQLPWSQRLTLREPAERVGSLTEVLVDIDVLIHKTVATVPVSSRQLLGFSCTFSYAVANKYVADPFGTTLHHFAHNVCVR